MGVDDEKPDGVQIGKDRYILTTESSGNSLFWQKMILLVFTISFVAGGWVPKEDILFSIFTSIYIEFMNRKVFPTVTSSLVPGMFPGRIFAYYITSAVVLGMILPTLYVCGAFIQGDMTAFKEAVPPLFLLLAQILTEMYTCMNSSYSLMIRALVPIMYNTRRVFSIWSWTLFVFGEGVDPAFTTGVWLQFGKIVAVLQVIIWNYNLFAFLLPIFLPGTIRKYQEVKQKLRS